MKFAAEDVFKLRSSIPLMVQGEDKLQQARRRICSVPGLEKECERISDLCDDIRQLFYHMNGLLRGEGFDLSKMDKKPEAS